MNDAAMAGGDSSSGDSRVLGIVRKFREAGMEQPVAEAVGEELAKLPTRAEVREEIRREIRLALAEYHQKIVFLMLAMHGFSVALTTFLITVIFLFLK